MKSKYNFFYNRHLRYITAVYFSVTTMLTVGYGDIVNFFN